MTYNFTFSFTDRATYVAFRTDWRARYEAISQEIRANKREQRSEKGEAVETLQSALHYLRIRANKMMLERTAATEFKNAQLVALATAEAA